MEITEQFDLRVKEIMDDKDKAEEIVKKYWNALGQLPPPTLTTWKGLVTVQ